MNLCKLKPVLGQLDGNQFDPLHKNQELLLIENIFRMSPESLNLRQYSEKTDVYSFGVLLYELLTRQIPFADLDVMQVGINVATGKVSIMNYIPSNHGYNKKLVALMQVIILKK